MPNFKGPYSEQTWADHNLSYPLSAARMLHLEEGPRISARQYGVNIEEFGAKGDGVTDNGTAINEALATATEQAVFVPPGNFLTSQALKIPQQTRLYGSNRWTSTITGTGNINLLDITGTGNVEINNLTLESATKQTTGSSAINFNNGFVSNAYLHNLTIGNKFWNGINIVGNVANIGAVKVHDIHFIGAASAAKEYGNAAIRIGEGTAGEGKRVNVVQLVNIHVQAATAADMPKAIEINNADTVQIVNCLLQTAEVGLSIGASDVSSKRCTNFYATNLVADGCTTGFKLSSMFSGELVACHAEACTEGVLFGETLSGVNWTGGSVYASTGDGIKLLASSAPVNSITISGATIANNGQNKEAARAGIAIASKAGGLLVTGCTIGNPELVGPSTKEQKVGVLVGAKAENIGIFGNRFVKNGTATVKKEGEEVEVKEANNLAL